MKGFKKVALVLMALVTVSSSFAACFGGGDNSGAGGNEPVDPNKTQLVIGYKDAGYGRAWVQNAEQMFETKFANYSFEEGKTGVQVQVIYDKEAFSKWNFYNSYNARGEHMYLGADIWYSMYNENHLYKLDTLVDEPLNKFDGKDLDVFGESKTIRAKVSGWAKKNAFWENGVWSLGTSQSLFGLTVYDVDLFEEKGYFFAEDGTFTTGKAGAKAKSKGFDGIAGTYDDGMPVTEADFSKLLNIIKVKTDIPFTFTGSENPEYATGWANLEAANYDDGKAQDIFNTGYGEYTLIHKNADGSYSLDAEPTTFNGAYNFYENARFPGKLAAIRHTYDFVKDSTNYSGETFKTAQTHIEAQNEFLTSIKSGDRVAMIMEGSWWETEASDTFTRMANQDSSMSKHNRRFGIMPPIKLDGSTATKHTYLSNFSGAWIPQKTAKADANDGGTFEACKMFIKMMATDEFLNMFTKTTNIPVAFDIEYTQDTLNSLTHFGKQLMEIAKNENNTHYFSVENRQWHPAFKNGAGTYPYAFQCNIEDKNSTSTYESQPMKYFRFEKNGKTAEQYFDSMWDFATLVYDKEFAKDFGNRS